MEPSFVLTVVIPSYNAQDYLDRAVSSVRGFDQVEVLIVDDGSTDATAEIADGLVQSDPDHIRVIHQENAGHGGAVNAGIAGARGRYLKILDADDWLDRLALKRALERLELREAQGEPLDLLVANYVYEKQGSHPLRKCDAQGSRHLMGSDSPLPVRPVSDDACLNLADRFGSSLWSGPS